MGTIRFEGTDEAVRAVSDFVTQRGTLDIQFPGADFALDCDEVLRKAGVGVEHPAFGRVFSSILPVHVSVARGVAKQVRRARQYAATNETLRQVILANPVPYGLAAAYETAARISNGARVVVLHGTPGKSTALALLQQAYADRACRDTEPHAFGVIPHVVTEIFPLDSGVLSSAGQCRLGLIWARVLAGTWKSGTIVLMDEAEMNLTIAWQKSLVGALLDLAATHDVHFVLATRSPYVINQHHDLVLRVGALE